MTWFADLSPCDYFMADATPYLRAVGWLSSDQAFPTGSVAPALFERLCAFLVDPHQGLGSFGGFHTCDLCPPDPLRPFSQLSREYAGHPLRLGWSNLFVPWKKERALFVAPSLIAHYVAEHGYLPPAPFLDALRDCPDMSSADYLLAVHEYGPPLAHWQNGIARTVEGRAAQGHSYENCADLVPILLEVLRRARHGRHGPTIELPARALAAIGVAARVALPELERCREEWLQVAGVVVTIEDALREIRAAVRDAEEFRGPPDPPPGRRRSGRDRA